jgi:putative colanic acid biosynthesis acetyltransferase WcaF
MAKLYYKNKNQKDAYTASWSLKEMIGIRLWYIVWLIFFRYSPKKIGRYWRIFLLKIFGAKLDWDVFIYSSSKIHLPWNLKMDSKSCLGPFSEVYNLGFVHFKEKVTVSQYVYICNGTHDLSNPKYPLMIGEIEIGKNVFIGARAFIMPGIKIEDNAVVGACSVVTKNVSDSDIVGGNPAQFIKKRIINE